jgi:hypothetical protein
MKYMLIVKATLDSEAGILPSKELVAEIMQFNRDMAKAGVLVGLDGLHPSSKGARVHFSRGKVTMTDGPFTETKELIAGFWLIDVKSKEEAVAWAMCAPAPQDADLETYIEVRQIFDKADFPPEILAQDEFDRVCDALVGR